MRQKETLKTFLPNDSNDYGLLTQIQRIHQILSTIQQDKQCDDWQKKRHDSAQKKRRKTSREKQIETSDSKNCFDLTVKRRKLVKKCKYQTLV